LFAGAWRRALAFSALCACAAIAAMLRPPAVPLVVYDPYQSIWSTSDNLFDSWPQHWSGPVMALCGAARIDGVAYRFLGLDTVSVSGALPMTQLSVSVAATHTDYVFAAGGVQLNVSFFTYAEPFDADAALKALSYPLTFVTMAAASIDAAAHSVELYFDHTAELAVKHVSQPVIWARVAPPPPGTAALMRVGTVAQDVLGTRGDAVKIDWGYAYLALLDSLDAAQSASVMTSSTAARGAFNAGNPFPTDDPPVPRPCDSQWPVLALRVALQPVTSSQPRTATALLAYDDIFSLDYFGEKLQPLWRVAFNGSAPSLVAFAAASFPQWDAAGREVDAQVAAMLAAAGGEKLATLGALAFRQVTGATKAVWSEAAGEAWLFMKEISSDGDVSTVDVVYPSAPFWLALPGFADPLRRLLVPILQYANNATSIAYNLPWAPHHLGTWPICDITPSEQEQMPIEETANMLIMLAALARRESCDVAWLQPYWPLLSGWAAYLNSSLPFPGNQLCTDDFEGPSPNNTNLAAKGIVGLAAYAVLRQCAGDPAGFANYLTLAAAFERVWEAYAWSGDHYSLEYGLNASWSLKYNLLFDVVFDTAVFPASVVAAEDAFYAQRASAFGVPLDSRATFTKLDWLGEFATKGVGGTALLT
jgi:hypothetical protein